MADIAYDRALIADMLDAAAMRDERKFRPGALAGQARLLREADNADAQGAGRTVSRKPASDPPHCPTCGCGQPVSEPAQCDQIVLGDLQEPRKCAFKAMRGDTLCKRHRALADRTGYVASKEVGHG